MMTVVLKTTNGTITITVLMILKNGDLKINLDDVDVQAIISGITSTKSV